MNRYNNWEQLLEYCNEDLKPFGYEVKVRDLYDDGYYTCEIFKGDVSIECYAENYFEDELADLVNEVWHYAVNKFTK